MKIAIIADIHDNLANLEIFLSWSRRQNIETIINCGDSTNQETLAWLATNFPGEIILVRGNADNFSQEELLPWPNIKYDGETSKCCLGGLNIGACHEPEKIERLQKESERLLDFIFYGHTHRPDFKKEGKTIIANPGTMGGVFYQPAFAILDSDSKNLELKLLHELKD
jgi:putative phosphoesterase